MQMRALMPGDQEQMVELLLTYRTAGYVERQPTVWRFQLMLSSRVWDIERDVQLWENDQGKLTACALLWKRRPDDTVYALERVVHPDIVGTSLPASVLEWAIDRIAVESAEKGSSMKLAVQPLEQNMEQDKRLLESMGFTRNTEGYVTYMKMPLTHPVAPARLPQGFQLLPLAEEDLERYQAAYGFTAVNIEHQRALLQNPEYQHFVIKAPDGTFAAYLECSFSRAEWGQNQQRVGWIDYIQTQADFQGRGLGQALIFKGFEHLRTQGANCVMLITAHDNTPAQALFQKVGMDFAPAEYIYLKDINASSVERTSDV